MPQVSQSLKCSAVRVHQEQKELTNLLDVLELNYC